MIKKINNLNKFKNTKLIKSGFVLLTTASLAVISGCNSKNLEDYYLVSKDGGYSICYRVGPFSNYDDYDYNSILNNVTIGSICSNGNSFDYELHHFAINFISELQVVNLKELLSLDKMEYSALISLAGSNELQQLGDNYFKNRNYYSNVDLKYSTGAKLKVFKTDEKVIIGYDISPKRIDNTNRYIFSIIDSDTLVFHIDDDIISYSINTDDFDLSYITYDTALSISEDYDNQKVLKK